MKWSTAVSLVVFFKFLSITECTVNYNYNTPPQRVLKNDKDNRVRGIQDRDGKDIILGGLFALH